MTNDATRITDTDTAVFMTPIHEWDITFGLCRPGEGFTIHLSTVGGKPVPYPNRFQRWMLAKFFGMHWTDRRGPAR